MILAIRIILLVFGVLFFFGAAGANTEQRGYLNIICAVAVETLLLLSFKIV